MNLDANFWKMTGEYSREIEEPEVTLSRARFLKSNGLFDIAISDYIHYLKKCSADSSAYLDLAECYLFLSDLINAVENFEKGFELCDGDYPESYLCNYANCLIELTEYDLAMSIVDVLLDQNPNHEMGIITKCRILIELKDFEKAFNTITKAIELNNKYYLSWATRLKIDFELEYYDIAVKDYKNALSLNPNLSFDYQRVYAMVLYKQRRFDEARKNFQNASELGDKRSSELLKTLF